VVDGTFLYQNMSYNVLYMCSIDIDLEEVMSMKWGVIYFVRLLDY